MLFCCYLNVFLLVSEIPKPHKSEPEHPQISQNTKTPDTFKHAVSNQRGDPLFRFRTRVCECITLWLFRAYQIIPSTKTPDTCNNNASNQRGDPLTRARIHECIWRFCFLWFLGGRSLCRKQGLGAQRGTQAQSRETQGPRESKPRRGPRPREGRTKERGGDGDEA